MRPRPPPRPRRRRREPTASCTTTCTNEYIMKIAIVGAGAIGGYLGGWLSAAGEDVTFIARGANLAAIRAHGMRVVAEDGAEVTATNARAVERMSDAGPQDAVLLTVKAHQVADVAGDLHHLYHDETS